MAPLEIYQLHNGYCYNTDSLVLADFARAFLKPNISLLDIGAGSGILGLLCAREILQKAHKDSSYTIPPQNPPNVNLHLVEKDLLMAQCATLNTRCFESQLHSQVHCMDFLDFQTDMKFDIIISNPPFYAKGALQGENMRKNMARHQSFLPLSSMLSHIKRVIKPNGSLCLCYDARELQTLLYELKVCGFNVDILRFVHSLQNRESSLALLRAKIQSKSPLRVLSPLFTHKSTLQTDNTDELQAIYAWAKTKSIKITPSELESLLTSTEIPKGAE